MEAVVKFETSRYHIELWDPRRSRVTSRTDPPAITQRVVDVDGDSDEDPHSCTGWTFKTRPSCKMD